MRRRRKKTRTRCSKTVWAGFLPQWKNRGTCLWHQLRPRGNASACCSPVTLWDNLAVHSFTERFVCMSGEGITKKISKICFYSLNCLNQRTFLGHKTEFDLLQKDEKTYISFIVRHRRQLELFLHNSGILQTSPQNKSLGDPMWFRKGRQKAQLQSF